MRILFDHNLPRALRRSLPSHFVQLAADLGWEELKNGALLKAAETAGFDLMITADQNIRYQQNLKERRIALIVLRANRWTYVRAHLPEIISAVDSARSGSFAFVEVPLPPKPTYQRAD
jgi:predicted nuclease of predicted toxin-antitoxin system